MTRFPKRMVTLAAIGSALLLTTTACGTKHETTPEEHDKESAHQHIEHEDHPANPLAPSDNTQTCVLGFLNITQSYSPKEIKSPIVALKKGLSYTIPGSPAQKILNGLTEADAHSFADKDMWNSWVSNDSQITTSVGIIKTKNVNDREAVVTAKSRQSVFTKTGDITPLHWRYYDFTVRKVGDVWLIWKINGNTTVQDDIDEDHVAKHTKE